MSFKVTVNTHTETKTLKFPALRIWTDADCVFAEKYGPLIVLFTDEQTGVVLSGRSEHQLGRVEDCWVSIDSDKWSPCSITLTSET